MQALKNHTVVAPALFFLSLLWTGLAFAQGTAGYRNSIGGFLGATDRYDTDFTFGAEYEHQLQQRPWSVGAILEHTPNVVLGHDYTVVLATAHYRPFSIPLLKLTGGAGVEFRSGAGNHLRFRFGAGYDIYKQGQITVTPRVAVDFGQGTTGVVFGISALYGF
ncbi:MAG: hypothetical protein P8126_12060 [Gammaproteobacteria bacterium]|jgi:hypothetical protein